MATVGRTLQVPSNPLTAPPLLLLLLGLDQLCTAGAQVAGGWAALTSFPSNSCLLQGFALSCSLMIKILYADHKDCCLCLSFFIKTNRRIWDPLDLLRVIYMATASSWGKQSKHSHGLRASHPHPALSGPSTQPQPHRRRPLVGLPISIFITRPWIGGGQREATHTDFSYLAF